MKYLINVATMFFLMNGLFAQTPTYSEDVASIIYNNCTKCHRVGGIAPFTLLSYNDAYAWSWSISYAVSNHIMPPWPPDVSYRSFLHERTLSQTEINTIIDWVNGGAPEGNPNLAPAVPNFPNGKILPGTPDLTLTMPVHISQADSSDEYACFTLPSGLTEDRFIRAVEVVPGNPAVVHHAIVFAADANITDCLMPILAGQTIVGYAPGAPPTVFPDGDDLKLGMKLNAGSNVMLQIHYPEGTAGALDSTSVNFYFYPTNTMGIREVISGPYVQNFLFILPANTVQTINGFYPYLPGTTTTEDLSILAVFPHMHLIGKKITSYAVNATNDTIPLVRINDWDFEWQGFYFYENLVRIPTGSRLLGHGIYDNTVNNHNNPNNPPQNIIVGEATTDEMFLISYLSLPYLPGDENYDLASMMSVAVNEFNQNEKSGISITVHPNPTSSQFEIRGWNLGDVNVKTEITIQDLLGHTISTSELRGNDSVVHLHLNQHPNGIYLITLKKGVRYASRKVVLIK